jgi:uncharacterized protein (TIGR02145 family)
MVENLKTTRLNDGTPISNVNDITKWSGLSTPAYCWYNNDIANKELFGALYNWPVVNTGKLAPAGWHIPTYDEWTALVAYLGGGVIEAPKKLKEAGTAHWITNDATNESGFTALPGGVLAAGDGGSEFYAFGYYGSWWTTSFETPTSLPWIQMIHDSGAYLANEYSLSNGLSVRCIKD